MSDTPRLSAEQRYEAEVLLERILGDEDEARHFVFETLYVRAKLENELDEARRDAERYRWLVPRLLCIDPLYDRLVGEASLRSLRFDAGKIRLSKDSVDAAIDAETKEDEK